MNNGPYVQPVSRRQWWLGASLYRRYMLRELTSLFLGAYAFTLIIGLWRLSQGAGAFDGWLTAMQSPVGLVFNAAMLVAAVYHSSTWFNVTPSAMVVRIGTGKLPGAIIIAAHYAAWLLVSVGVYLLVRSTGS